MGLSHYSIECGSLGERSVRRAFVVRVSRVSASQQHAAMRDCRAALADRGGAWLARYPGMRMPRGSRAAAAAALTDVDSLTNHECASTRDAP